MSTIRVFTIGFTKKSAEQFFTALQAHGVKRVLDIRLNNTSQLAGFAKKDDLAFFLRAICAIDYVHVPELAPTAAILDAYKRQRGDWRVYEQAFLDLMAERKVEDSLAPALLDGGCLLCSEATPRHCHRRLVVEYLGRKWGNLEVTHIE